MIKAGKISIEPSGAARIDGALTLDTVAAVYQQAEQAASQGRYLTSLDLGGVTRVDSSGLALLLEWQSLAHRAGRCITIHAAPTDLLSLASLCEAADLLSINGRVNGTEGEGLRQHQGMSP